LIFSTTGAAWSRTFFQVSATVSATLSAAAEARFWVAPRASTARFWVEPSASAARFCVASSASAVRFWVASRASSAIVWALSARSRAASRIAAIAERPAEAPGIDERLLARTIRAITPISAAPAAAEMRSALVGSSRA